VFSCFAASHKCLVRMGLSSECTGTCERTCVFMRCSGGGGGKGGNCTKTCVFRFIRRRWDSKGRLSRGGKKRDQKKSIQPDFRMGQNGVSGKKNRQRLWPIKEHGLTLQQTEHKGIWGSEKKKTKPAGRAQRRRDGR